MKKYLLRAPAQQTNEAATFFNSRLSRSGGELITICKALLADGVVNPAEAKFLQSWLKDNHAAAQSWPFVDLIHRLDAIFADGQASAEECEELAVALNTIAEGALVRSDPRLPGYGMASAPAQIFDSPAPAVEFPGREFCATGVFLHGTRGAVEKAIQQRGGSTIKAPRAATNYVLVGSFVSPGWSHGQFGSKLIRAMSLKRNGASVAIIGEEHWAKYLGAKENLPPAPAYQSLAFAVSDAHRAAFKTFAFSSGDTLYDNVEAYQMPWLAALQHVKFALQIESASPGREGPLSFTVLAPNEDATALREVSRHEVTQEQFSEVLKRGLSALS